MTTVLIADDHADITKILADYAKSEGYRVLIARDGEEALQLFRENHVDQVLLDVMMPKIDGFEVCRTIRRTSSVPIIMITARGDDFERIMGLDYGADDYIVKPFSPGEVMARIRAIQRRAKANEEVKEALKIHNLSVFPLENLAVIDADEIPLTRTEVDLLYLLASNPERVFTRDQLLDLLWGFDYAGDARTVDSHIKRLRAKLISPHPAWDIKTVRGRGYQFTSAK
ncbi:MAG TPA: response regulator transcription factor [Bacillota bacterium]|nr:response regulator transcription factor [Bacillota bacterium]